MQTPETDVNEGLVDKIESSPLLNKRTPQPPMANSTINLDKLDKARFSEMKEMESENSSVRIIIYVLIVIVIGVGLALLVRQLLSQQTAPTTDQSATQTPVSTPVVQTNTALIVSTLGLPDVQASNLAANTDYMDSTISTLGDSTVDMSQLSLDSMHYTDYETFSRLTFDMSGSSSVLPKVNLSYDATKMTLTVEIVGLKNINSNLKQDLQIHSLVSEVRFDQVTKKYIIFLTDKFDYRVLADNGNLVLDFKTLTNLQKSTNASTSTGTETTTTTTDTSSSSNSSTSTKPTAPHYTNDFSQDQQYVVSKVLDSSIILNNYYIWDQGQYFEFSWAQEKQIGDAFVPNAVAHLETTDGVNYLVIEIDNLAGANLADGVTADQLQTKTGLNMAGANFLALTRDSFDTATGKAVYRIQLRNKADYQLLDQTTEDGKTQILSVQIKD